MPCSLVKRIALSVLAMALIISVYPTGAAAGVQPQSARPMCDQQQALLLIQQQVDESKKLDDTVSRIVIMVRAADALWPHREETARDIFAQAYDLAEKLFREKGDESKQEGRLTVQAPDQRFSVMHAIGRRDTEWARRLAERISEETREAEERVSEDARRKAASTNGNRNEGQKFLSLAMSLLKTDRQTAISLARTSFGYENSFMLSWFLVRLAEQDQQAANQLYREALDNYAAAPMYEFLNLSAYPFGSSRIAGPGAFSSALTPPESFAPDSELQVLFLETLFRRAESSLKVTDSPVGGPYNLPETAQIFISLSRLEPVVARYLPGYAERVAALKTVMGAALFADTRQQAMDILRNFEFIETGNRFERAIEGAERETTAAGRDRSWAFAVLNAPDSESLERLRDLAQKISDPKTRSQMLNWLYFKRTQKAVKEGLLEDARQLAGKVERLDHRAYLSYEIASESLKRLDDKTRAREVLDEVVTAAHKSDNTNEKARTLLGVVHLYAGFDQIRAREVMSDAIKTINAIAEPDLTGSAVFQPVEGVTFAHYSRYEVQGFSLEFTFRRIGPFDFEGALLLARGIENRSLRSLALISLSASCLEELEKSRKQEKADKRSPNKQ